MKLSKESIREYFILTGILLALVLVLYSLFYFVLTYFNPNKNLCLLVNRYGEANIEIIVLPFFSGVSIYGLWISIKERLSK